MIKTNYGFSWPVLPVTMILGVLVVILLIAGIALDCYVYQMGKTFKLVIGIVKQVAKKLLSGCCLLFSRAFKRARPGTPPPSIPPQETIEHVREARLTEIHPVQMTKILRDVFQDPKRAHIYAKYLDKKVQAGSSVSVELKVNPDSEGPKKPPY